VPTKQEDCAESGYDPGGHGVHVADPAPATDPDGHLTHVSADVARRTMLNVPAGHKAHTEEPSDSLYEPSGQSEQSEAFLPPIFDLAVPATQNWSQKADPFVMTQEPGGQRRHAVLPVTGVYEPAGHGFGFDIPTVGQNAPVGQTDGDSEPAGQNVPIEH